MRGRRPVPRLHRWFGLVDDEYVDEMVAPGASARSSAVPGLELRVRQREAWAPGQKIDVLYRGELRPRLAVEQARAEQERARAEQESARADALEARLRELGLHDPDASSEAD